MSISISFVGKNIGKTIGSLLVVTSCGWITPVTAQSINETPLVAQIITPTPAPNSLANSLEQRANEAYVAGEADLAVNLYSQLLQQQPNSYLFQVRLAVAMLNAGPEYMSRSYEAFQKARDLSPNIDEPLIYLGQLEESLEQPAKALANYQRAYELNPSNQDAFINIQRLQAQVALPAMPEGLEVIEKRNLADYLAAVESNSRLLQGLREQQSIIRNLAWRSALPNLNLSYSWTRFNSNSPDSGAADPCIGGRRQSNQQICGGGAGTSGGFSIGVNWNLTELFVNSNQLRLRGYEDRIKENLQELKTETQRLFTIRGSLLEEFRQLSWQAALDPSDRNIRYNRRDRYLQILYISQQIHSITGLY
jgi:tetratricopeptide (TPR) repeat protein